jgi:hypothetical protein
VAQLSFFSAEANPPRVGDLAGLLCCQGELASFGATAARLAVVVDEPWRARAIAGALTERGIEPEVTAVEERLLVRTAFRADLLDLSRQWSAGSMKAVPPGLQLDGAMLRLWAMAAGRAADGGGYLLALDPNAPETHEPLGGALARCGLAATMVGVRGGGPGLRVSGQRRCNRLAELVGPAPSELARARWPAVSRVRATG